MRESTYPAETQALLTRIVNGFHHVMGDTLSGIYLHGSLVLGGFHPVTSDIDFVALAARSLTLAEKQALVTLTLELAPLAPPKGLEYSIVLLDTAQHFQHPAPYELHYSRDWHESYLRGAIDLNGINTDPDLAAHFTIIRHAGHCLYGMSIANAFGEVPEADYWDSIRADARDILDNLTFNPVYSVLNLCRVLAYQQEKRIVSKAGGAAWALAHVDKRFHPLIQQALAVYQAQSPAREGWDEGELRQFGDAIGALILG